MNSDDVREATLWLDKADYDLQVAAWDLKAQPPFLEDVLFRCQQAVEKSLKAYPVANAQSVPKTHDLERLTQNCREFDKTLPVFSEAVLRLTAYSSLFRYPETADVPAREEVLHYLDIDRSLLDEIRRRVLTRT